MVRQPLLLRARLQFEQFGRGVNAFVRGGARPGQPHRRAHRLQRRLRAADGDRPALAVAFAPRQDACSVRARQSAGRPASCRSTRSGGEPRPKPDKRSARGGWFGYVAGVAWAMLGAGYALRGADLAIASEVPAGAGLASSAALESAVARALAAVSELEWDPQKRRAARAAVRTRVRGRGLRHNGRVLGRIGARRLRAPD